MKTPLGIIAAAVAAYFFVSLGLVPIPAWAVAPVASPKIATVKKYLESCLGKPATEAGCDKIRKDTVEIVKEDVLTLGSSADRGYLLSILPIFKSEEPELRIAAADAIGMIGPQDSDVEFLAPVANDPVPDVRRAVAQMISRGKGSAISLLGQRIVSMRMGLTPEMPADPAKFNLPVAADSTYLFDSSDTSVGRVSYVAKGKNDLAQFYKAKAKKGPFKLDEFKDKYRYQLQDEQEALNQAQETEAKQLEKVKPPDPTNTQAFMEYMGMMQSLNAGRTSRMFLDSYQPALYGAPTVYVLEERQIGKRTYPTRYVVLYHELAFKRPGYRFSWVTVSDDLIKTAQATSLAEEKEELANRAESEAVKKKQAELDALTKKKDAADKKQFKKGQDDLEKALGF